MSIVFAAIAPHNPILIPGIGKENSKKLKNTLKAYEKIAAELKESNAEIIFIISPHGIIYGEAFCMNLNPEFSGSLDEFGNCEVSNWPGDVMSAYKIKEALEAKTQLQLISEKKLDYGATVPLKLLTKNLKDVKIIPFYHSGQTLAENFNFGKLVGKLLSANTKKIAVIASADLSHKVTKNAPGGYSPKGKKFDKKIVNLLENNKTEELINLTPEVIEEEKACGLKSIALLLGIINEVKFNNKLLSYEAPFGIGHMVMDYKF